ncbi:MAG: D-alanyl-D-alanine carboxypeptidase/D-alanyl-D-alanine-endopeptidase, partial [Gemmatimonadetes bacterium]|nr:D-alanyl-D-alanine carboxypeptidase/D-alanyl-D-alanine-endopeptidase [Gemmatimonadota bacterium]
MRPAAGAAVLMGALLPGCWAGSGGGVGTTAPTAVSPAAALADVMAEPPLDRTHWGVLAVDAASGRVLLERNAGRLFVPASNQKLLVTAAALERLGPDWRWQTELWAAGAVEGATLRGDLVLPGTGDPTLSSRFWPSADAPLEALADSVVAAGVGEVEGALVVDASAWDSTAVPGTWQVYDLPWRYAASGGAFAVAEGETTVVVRGGARSGEGVAVAWEPVGEAGFLVPRLVTVPADSASGYRPRWHPETRRLVLEGEVPAGEVDTLRIATRDPVRQAAAALHRALEERGVAVRDGWRVAWERDVALAGGCATGFVPRCPGARRLAGLESPPLDAVVEAILEPSQNWIAEQLLSALGGAVGEEASRTGGLDVVRAFLVEDVGVDSLDLELHDASGMSPYNLVTPRALVALLRHMAASRHARTFRHALAEPGEEDSTLENRLGGLEGRLFAKTGTISPAADTSTLSRPALISPMRLATRSALMPGPGSRFGHDVTMRQTIASCARTMFGAIRGAATPAAPAARKR